MTTRINKNLLKQFTELTKVDPDQTDVEIKVSKHGTPFLVIKEHALYYRCQSDDFVMHYPWPAYDQPQEHFVFDSINSCLNYLNQEVR